jgi:hypothetical protein
VNVDSVDGSRQCPALGTDGASLGIVSAEETPELDCTEVVGGC